MDLQDLFDIRETLARYGHVIDTSDWERARDVFCEDYVLDRRSMGLDDVIGIDALIDSGKAAKGFVYFHLTTDVEVLSVEGDKATTRSKMISMVGEQQELFTGIYRDVLQRMPEGWRLKKRELEQLASPRSI